jgi:hypothetical protein
LELEPDDLNRAVKGFRLDPGAGVAPGVGVAEV